MSETLLLSLDCFRSSAGFRVRTTTTARMAIIAMTTRSSMRVKPFSERNDPRLYILELYHFRERDNMIPLEKITIKQ